MGRPSRLNADFFKHDTDMRNDPKIRAVRAKFGLEGYAVWCLLLETLSDSDGFSIPWDALSVEIYAGDFSMPGDQLSEIVHYLSLLNLIQIEGEKLCCQKLSARLASLIEKRERMQERYNSQFLPQKKAETEVSAAETTQSRVEKSREEKSRVENKNTHSADADFFEENGQKTENKSENSEEEENTQNPQAAAAPLTPVELVWQWCTGNLEQLRKWADDEGFLPAHGTVKNEIKKFGAWYSGPKAKPEFRGKFEVDPVGFFKHEFRGWIQRTVEQSERQWPAKNSKRSAATSPAFTPKTEDQILKLFRARYGLEMADRLTRQNLDKLMQANTQEDFENWAIGFYQRLKNDNSTASRPPTGPTSLASLITKPAAT